MQLFSESPARALVSLPAAHLDAFEALCADNGVPSARLGEVTGEGSVTVVDLFSLPLSDLRAAWEAPIPRAMHVDH